MVGRAAVTTWQDLLHPGRAPRFFEPRPLPVFDPHATAYHPGNAWWLAELSRLVYRHDIEEDARPLLPPRGRFLTAVGLRQLAFFNAPLAGTQGYLVSPVAPIAYAALVFRGTETRIRDVAHDLEVRTVPLANDTARVHEGFASALDAVWDEVDRELDRLVCPVFFAGHSLGAALATLAASRRSPRALYTFGSPRVGNAAFAATFGDIPVFRVTTPADVVTTLPPEPLGYAHVGELHQLDAPATTVTVRGPLAWLHRLRNPPAALADHAPINYVVGLTARFAAAGENGARPGNLDRRS